MTVDLLIIQHHQAEGPGRILDWTQQSKLKYDIRCFADTLPESSSTYAALLLLGGPLSANNNHPRLVAELALIKQFLAAEKPILGICLGAQLLAVALGCEVKPMIKPELGWHPVSFGSEELSVPQWHEDEIVANSMMDVLATSQVCQNQMFTAKKNLLGFQFHPEWANSSIRKLHQHFDPCPLLPCEKPSTQPRLQSFLFNCLNKWWQGQPIVVDQSSCEWVNPDG